MPREGDARNCPIVRETSVKLTTPNVKTHLLGAPYGRDHQPHDKFFKEMLTQPEAARSLLRDFLPPAVASQLDLSRMHLVKCCSSTRAVWTA